MIIFVSPSTRSLFFMTSFGWGDSSASLSLMKSFSGARFSYLASVFILGLFALAVISFLTPYRWQRITSFVNPQANTQTSSYQINQAKIAIGSSIACGMVLLESRSENKIKKIKFAKGTFCSYL